MAARATAAKAATLEVPDLGTVMAVAVGTFEWDPQSRSKVGNPRWDFRGMETADLPNITVYVRDADHADGGGKYSYRILRATLEWFGEAIPGAGGGAKQGSAGGSKLGWA